MSTTTRLLLVLLSAFGLLAGCERAPSAAPPAAEPVAHPTVAPPVADAWARYPGLAQVPDGEEREAVQNTILRIGAGGPFPYPEKDGTVFGNFEGRLPRQTRGHYREYTVPTPGLTHRGPRRVVAGRTGEMFYTRDHYESFRRLTP